MIDIDTPVKYAESDTFCFVTTYFHVRPGLPKELLFVTVHSTLEKAMKARLLDDPKNGVLGDILVAPEWDEPIFSNGEFLACDGHLRYDDRYSVLAVILKEIID